MFFMHALQPHPYSLTLNELLDPYLENVTLLLHMDGADESTAFIDSTYYPATLTATNGAKMDTGAQKFGTTAGYFNGSSSYLSTNRAVNVGAGAFTMEAWVYPVAAGTMRVISAAASGTPNAFIYLRLNSDLSVTFGIRSNAGTGFTNLNSSAAAAPLNTWTHLAVTRDGAGLINLWVNGVSVASATATTDPTGVPNYMIGAGTNGGTEFFNGYIDEVRITEGISRYTGPFTPATAAFPDASA